MLEVRNTPELRTVSSASYNYVFDKKNGNFVRWGKDENDDPDGAPSPELADIEVTTICDGINGKVCKHCYKSNTPEGENMSLETFKRVLGQINASGLLTQVAFGADSHGTSNPELFDMMAYCREQDVVPNITVADITDETADNLAGVCGAVAVSRYADADACYDTVKRLTDRGMKQVNIHLMISEETFEMACQTFKDVRSDPRLKGLKAVVLLSLKQKGRGTSYTSLSQKRFNQLIEYATCYKIHLGFDSCSASKFVKAVGTDYMTYVEPCESTLFSIFVNTHGKAFPCSFAEDCKGWEDGLDVVDCDDFTKDVWNDPKMKAFRETLLTTAEKDPHGCRTCPLYNV